MRCVPMTVTVQTMRSAAAVDVDVSVWRYLQVCYTNALVIFFSITVIHSVIWFLCVCITEKPGVCPKKLGVAVSGVCHEMCSHDGDCPNDEKCCSNGCGHQCTDLSIGMLY